MEHTNEDNPEYGELVTLNMNSVLVADDQVQDTDNETRMNYTNDDEEELQRFGLTTDEGMVKFDGLLLGEGSSKRDSHTHRPNEPLPAGRACSGCRWTETRIFWSEDDEMWVIHTIGRSILEGETNRYKIVWASEPVDLIDSLMVKSKYVHNGVRQMELPKANAKALHEAADNDEEIYEAVKRQGLRQ